MLNTSSKLSGNRDFMTALAGRSASLFGDEVALVALTLRLQASGAHPYQVALLFAAGLVPFVLLARVADSPTRPTHGACWSAPPWLRPAAASR